MAFDLTMGGQFALIPAKVLYDDHIPATAKLLYGEIYRLSHANGYCYATNKDFMALLQRSENTVTDLIKALETAGYIRVKLIRRFGATGDIVQRRIFVGQTLAPEDPEDLDGGTPENCDTSPRKLADRPTENCDPTYKKKNNKRNTPIAPIEVLQAIEEYIGDDPEYRAAFDGFLANRVAIKKPVKTVRAISRIINRLRVVNCREVEIAMLDKATVNNWLDVYPLKPDEMPKAQQGRMEEQEGVEYF